MVTIKTRLILVIVASLLVVIPLLWIPTSAFAQDPDGTCEPMAGNGTTYTTVCWGKAIDNAGICEAIVTFNSPYWVIVDITPTVIYYGPIGVNAVSIQTNGQPPCPIFRDGRLNSYDGQQSVAVYCEGTTMSFWAIYKSQGYFAFNMTKEELAKFPTNPAKNTLLKQAKGVRLYRLAAGRLQVNRAMENGEEYSFIFDGCG